MTAEHPKQNNSRGCGIMLLILIAFLVFVMFNYEKSSKAEAAKENYKPCDCGLPTITIPPYATSWEDKAENWSYKECVIVPFEGYAEKLHVYVFYNAKLDTYRCELKYSWPAESCSSYSNLYGSRAVSTAELTKSAYESGVWKIFGYWQIRESKQ